MAPAVWLCIFRLSFALRAREFSRKKNRTARCVCCARSEQIEALAPGWWLFHAPASSEQCYIAGIWCHIVLDRKVPYWQNPHFLAHESRVSCATAVCCAPPDCEPDKKEQSSPIPSYRGVGRGSLLTKKYQVLFLSRVCCCPPPPEQGEGEQNTASRKDFCALDMADRGD